MKEKEKGKINPFIKELRPDEEILWLSMQPPMPFWRHLIGFILGALATILFMACFFSIFLTIFNLGDCSGPEGVTGDLLLACFLRSFLQSLTVIALLSFPFFVFLYLLSQHNTRQLRHSYAVTNQRLLTLTNGHLSEMALESISTVSSRKDTISFGQSFGYWSSIEDTVEVASLIRQARRERLKALKETAIA